ncbi:hypothetical protein Cch01nite_34370 [Cellulomonas chitinilytica]|uniref:Uncharacterized protein n=1 Tax=Cellulomonas chitinilytica TaxID=398759 RepID=A0A919P3T3_9CELL|nr:hypothetical protein [Cellulomonas chitinilytica]GIG22713.1 hypothetical protein Cch01nite_34370 [Cellulomonas chitinilytica]
MSAVLLSAGIPSADARGDAVRPFYPGDILAATSSTVEAVLRSGADLVFGGHPTISPVVLQLAALLDAGEQVHVWQSEVFASSITDEVRRLVTEHRAHLHMVAGEDGRDASLGSMRAAMIGAHDLAAAFFVGGMDGIAVELELLAGRTPRVPFFAFVTPGGMAGRVARDRALPTDALPAPDADARGRGLVGRAYGSLALSALDDVGLHARER